MWVVAGTTLGIAGALGACKARPAGEAARGGGPAPAASTAVASAASREAAPSLDAGVSSAAPCTPGTERRYRFDYQGSSKVDFRPLLDQKGKKPASAESGAVREVDVRVRGQLIITDVERGAQAGCVAVARMSGAEVRLSSGNVEGSEQMEGLKKLLGQQTPVVRDARGRVVGLHLDADSGPLPRSLWRGFWGLLQVSAPPLPAAHVATGTAWKEREEDTTGVYEARYEAMKDGPSDGGVAPLVVRKVKLAYLPPPARPGRIDPVQTYRIDGGLELQLDRVTGALVGLRGGETQEMDIAGKTVGRGRFTLALAQEAVQALEPAALAALASSVRARMAVPLAPLWQSDGIDTETSIHRTELGEATKDSLLAALLQAEKEGKEEDQSLYLKLKALVFLQPGVSAELGQILAGAPARGLSMRILSGALGSIGHAPAQEAIATAVRARKGEWAALSQLVPMFIDAESPTVATESLLRELCGSSEPPIASTAALVLGGLAHNLWAKEPARAEAIVSELLAKAEKPGSAGRTARYLQALGNTGSERILPLMERHFTGAVPALRAAAATGMRRIRLPRVDALLLGALVTEPDPKVRTELVSVTSSRPLTDAIVAAWKKALADQDAEVRQAVLRTLWNTREVVTDAVVLLRKLAKKDPSPDVRRSASELLKQP